MTIAKRIMQVTKVHWRMHVLSGQIFPVLELDPTKEYKITHQPLPNATQEIVQSLWNFESITVEENMFRLQKHKEFDQPALCPYCHSTVTWEEDSKLYCDNELCSGKSITGPYRMLSFTDLDELTVKDVEEYLTIFPLNRGNFTNILNVVTREMSLLNFLQLFKQIGPKDTAARRGELEKTFGTKGEELWRVECDLQRKLNNGFSYAEFWFLLNLPEVDDLIAADNLCDLNPYTIKEFLDSGREDKAQEAMLRTKSNPNVTASVLLQKSYWSKVLSYLQINVK